MCAFANMLILFALKDFLFIFFNHMVHGLWFMVCKSPRNKPSRVILVGVAGTSWDTMIFTEKLLGKAFAVFHREWYFFWWWPSNARIHLCQRKQQPFLGYCATCCEGSTGLISIILKLIKSVFIHILNNTLKLRLIKLCPSTFLAAWSSWCHWSSKTVWNVRSGTL